MKHSDKERIKKIVRYAKELLEYISEQKIDRERLLKEHPLQWLVTTPLYNIGEQAAYIGEEYQKMYSDIPWKRMANLRHRLVHDYDGTNWDIIADIVFDEIPILLEKLNEVR